MQVPLLGGSYVARTIVANAQRCINLYPEINRKDSVFPITHYQRPGLRVLAQGPNAPVRQLYRATNGQGFAAIGQGLYYVDPSWTLHHLGDMTPYRTNIVSMIDNATTLLAVDGSPNGFTVDLNSHVFAQLSDPTGLFQGADRVDYIDTFIIGNQPNTNLFFSTLSNLVQFDPTYIAGKTDYPDPLMTLIVNRHIIYLMGQLKSEIWYDVGGSLFPFAEMSWAYIEHGTIAKYSIASADVSVFWLGQDLQGQGVVFRQRGYQTDRISNHAVEVAIRRMAATATLSDAIGYTYQQDGHVFYVLTFPSGNQTWVWDEAMNDPTLGWHQRAWTNPADGTLNRDRTQCTAFFNETNVAGDWENGTLYALDLDHYSDDPLGIAGPITRIRTFPHLGRAQVAPGGQIVEIDGRRVNWDRFELDIECGNAPLEVGGSAAQISVRMSDDRGKTFGEKVLQTLGAPGEYLTWPLVLRTGNSRGRVFEVEYSAMGECALNGAWLNGMPSVT